MKNVFACALYKIVVIVSSQFIQTPSTITASPH
jgi:hypothetical protein